MKFSTALFACILFLLPVSLSLCQIIQIDEYDRQGKKETVNFEKSSFPIVDINSTLHIRIDKDIVRAKAIGLGLYNQVYDSEKLVAIIQILKEESDLLEIIGYKTGTTEQRKEKLKKFSARMGTLEDYIMTQKSMRNKANEIFETVFDENKSYALIISLVRDEIKAIINEIDRSLREQRIYFRVGGWLRNGSGNLQPIHLPQFDTYDEGKFYEVPRFIMPAPEELRQQYQKASDAAQEYNKNGVTAFDGIKAQIGSFVDSLKSTISCIDKNIKNCIDLSKDIEEIKKQIKPFLDQLESISIDVKNVVRIFQKVSETKDPWGMSASYINQLLELVKNIETKTPELVKLFDSTTKQLKEKSKAEAIAEISSIINDSLKCKKYLDSYKDRLKYFVDEIQKWFSLSVPDQMAVNLDLTEKVSRFLIEDIPESTEMDLRYAGRRSEGDEIFLKAVLEKKTESDSTQGVSYELERKSLTMFRIDWFAELSAGVVFLDPVNDSGVKLTKQFQAAPSYSLLFKWGSRKSYVYNKFWRFGFGVNVAAPDFDLDSTPEIGLGVTMTTALDYLQIGIGRNLGVDAWYWFFGLRLPIGTVTLTGNEKNIL